MRRFPRVTPDQLRVLVMFRDYRDANGVSPSLADLAKELGVSTPTVSGYLECLKVRGCIAMSPARYRPWILTVRGRRLAAKSSLEKIAA